MSGIVAAMRSFSAAVVTAVLFLAPVHADPQPSVPHIGVLVDDRGNTP
jgi:hypothetical protein